MTKPTDTVEQKLETVGRVFPHVSAKVVDSENRIVPRGARGELCVSGWLLQKGYYKNPEKTSEVMIRDKEGVLWMHTGDEATLDDEGYCRITGRIKDIIIRGKLNPSSTAMSSGADEIGGENIYPLEIEERLLEHPAISHASIVGLRDDKYGEAVAAFLQLRPGHTKLSLKEVRDWVQQRLGRHKAPAHCFWVGPFGAVREYPLTGNGKIRKEILREIGHRITKDEFRPVLSRL